MASAQPVCPIDGQTLEWHMKVYGYSTHDRTCGHPQPIFFGDRLGCGFISPMDRQNYRKDG